MKNVAVGVAASVLVLSACGGSARLSKPDFQAKANGICSKYNARIKGALANVGTDPASLAQGVDTAVSYIKKGTKELDGLKPPKQYDANWKEYSRINHDEITTAGQLADAARSKSQSGMRSAVAKLGSQAKDSNRLARSMGLTTCAAGG